MDIAARIGWVGLGLIAALSASGVAIFGKLGLEDVDSTLATTLRSMVMTALLLLLIFATGRWKPLWAGAAKLDRRAWLFIVLAGFCGAISWLAYFAALQLGMAGKVAALDRLSVALVFVIGVLALGERYSWQGWLGLTFLVAGVYLIAGSK